MKTLYQHNAMQGDDRAQKRRYQAVFQTAVGRVKVQQFLDVSYGSQSSASVALWADGQGWLPVLQQEGLEGALAASYHSATPPQRGAWERSGELAKMAVVEAHRLAALAVELVGS